VHPFGTGKGVLPHPELTAHPTTGGNDAGGTNDSLLLILSGKVKILKAKLLSLRPFFKNSTPLVKLHKKRAELRVGNPFKIKGTGSLRSSYPPGLRIGGFFRNAQGKAHPPLKPLHPRNGRLEMIQTISELRKVERLSEEEGVETMASRDLNEVIEGIPCGKKDEEKGNDGKDFQSAVPPGAEVKAQNIPRTPGKNDDGERSFVSFHRWLLLHFPRIKQGCQVVKTQ
jgi:hypothetical protein